MVVPLLLPLPNASPAPKDEEGTDGAGRDDDGNAPKVEDGVIDWGGAGVSPPPKVDGKDDNDNDGVPKLFVLIARDDGAAGVVAEIPVNPENPFVVRAVDDTGDANPVKEGGGGGGSETVAATVAGITVVIGRTS